MATLQPPSRVCRNVMRDLEADLDCLKEDHGVTDVLCLLERPELPKFGVPRLFARLERRGIAWHHLPVPDGLPPEIGALEGALRLLRRMLRQGRVVLVHCYGGLGRTGVAVACLLLSVDEVRRGYTPTDTCSKC